MKILRLLLILIVFGLFAPAWAEGFGLIKIAVAPLREEPAHEAEMGTQAMLGTPVSLEKIVDEEWWQLTMPCGYKGYIHRSSIAVLNDEEARQWRSTKRVMSCVPVAWLLPDGEPVAASYAPYGSVLEYVEDAGYGRMRLRLPSGETALASADNFRDFSPAVSAVTAGDIEKAITLAQAMLGSPYLWGGTTMLAPDCSGLTQLAFREAGLLLPRNASQQALVGEPVEGLENAKRGDLIFFTSPTGRVDHVALYLGEGKLIQSSAWVWEGTFNKAEASEQFPYYGRRPAIIRRLTTSPDSTLLIANNPLYF